MPSSGLDGVSHHSTLVAGVNAARTASRSPRCTAVCSTPQPASTLAISRKLPPYASSGSTTWSPGRSTVRSSVSSAASPEANASPCAPPSSAARHSSSAVRVGLAERLYSYPPRSPPTPSCLYVEVWWIGTTTDPVLGSGSCPAWIASVSNPYRSPMPREATPRRATR